MRREQAAARQQIDLVLHVGRPPGVARGVHLEWQARELVELRATRRALDADSVAGEFGIGSHELSRVKCSTFLIAAGREKIIYMRSAARFSKPEPASLARSCPRSFQPLALLAPSG